MESAYAALRQIDAVEGRVVLEPGRPRLPHDWRPAEETGAPAFGINGESAATMTSKSGSSGASMAAPHR